MEKIKFEQKKKEFKKWARNDAKHYLFEIEGKENAESISDYYARVVAVYSKERLMTRFDYTEEQYNEILEWYNECFWQGFEYWQKKKNKMLETLKKYGLIFKEAEKIAKAVDVSDIQDGFPCGGVHLYLNPAEKNSELGQALKLHNSDYDSDPYCLSLPIRMPSHGQCIDFSQRICERVKEFLEAKDIPCLTHSYID